MLSNKDFASIVKGGDPSSSSKVRYDLKQVAQWDRQIKAEAEKKVNTKKKSRTKDKEDKDEKTDLSAYRDRALERRKEERKQGFDGNDEETLLVDKDKTQFLGGDLEHTHLVKGLDYALLAKIRSEVGEDLKKLENIDMENAEQLELKDIVPTTRLGHNLKALILSNKLRGFFPSEDNNMTNKETINQQDLDVKSSAANNLKQSYQTSAARLSLRERKPMSKTEEVLNRTVYEFDVNPLSSQDVPLTILRSKHESIFTEHYTHFALDAKQLDQIKSLYDPITGKIIPKAQRKAAVVVQQPQQPVQSTIPHPTVTTTAPNPFPQPTPVTKAVDSIYDDDLCVGTYSLTEQKQSSSQKVRRFPLNTIVVFSRDDLVETTKAGPQLEKSAIKAFGATKMVVPEVSSSRKVETTVLPKKTPTFKAETTITLAPQRAPTNVTMATNHKQNDQKKGHLINRDVFATTLEKVINVDENLGKKAGDVFGMRGDYDLFPETGDYETYDSDEEGLSANPKKRPKKK